jgi:hypothetical protein
VDIGEMIGAVFLLPDIAAWSPSTDSPAAQTAGPFFADAASRSLSVTEYQPDDVNKQTVLYRAGDPSPATVCLTLGEAAIFVKNSWSKDDQERARFKVASREYSWEDIAPHVA